MMERDRPRHTQEYPSHSTRLEKIENLNFLKKMFTAAFYHSNWICTDNFVFIFEIINYNKLRYCRQNVSKFFDT